MTEVYHSYNMAEQVGIWRESQWGSVYKTAEDGCVNKTAGKINWVNQEKDSFRDK